MPAGSEVGLKGVRYPVGAKPHLGEELLRLPNGGATLDTMAFPWDVRTCKAQWRNGGRGSGQSPPRRSLAVF